MAHFGLTHVSVCPVLQSGPNLAMPSRLEGTGESHFCSRKKTANIGGWGGRTEPNLAMPPSWLEGTGGSHFLFLEKMANSGGWGWKEIGEWGKMSVHVLVVVD